MDITPGAASATRQEECISICILALFLYLWSFRRADATLAIGRSDRRTGRELKVTTSAKRIVLANHPRLFREALHRALNKAEHLKVVQEVPDHAS